MAMANPRYLVLELRQNADGTMSQSGTSFDPTPEGKRAALNKFFAACAAASVSDKPIYTVVLTNVEGTEFKKEVFRNEVE